MTTEKKTNAGTRIASMLLDHIAMTIIAMIFFAPGFVSRIASAFEISHGPAKTVIFGQMSYFGLIGLALYFCKDCFQGRSLAKRLLKLQVVNNANGKTASPIRCFIRNIFCIIYPVEVIVTLASPSRRIGDLVAGTKVVPFNPDAEQPKIQFIQTGLALILAYGLMLLLMHPINQLDSILRSNPITCVESSLNEKAAAETEQLFTDSIGTTLTPDVRVYDQIEENKNLRYVSVILRVKENILDNDNSYEQLKSTTVALLLTKFPAKTFVGQIQYVYQQPGQLLIRTEHLDWREK